MQFFPFVLQCAALFCFLCAAFNWFTSPPPKPQWGWLGMSFWVASFMLDFVGLHQATSIH